MGQLIRLNTTNPLTRRIQQEVALRMDQIIQTRNATTLAIREGTMLQTGVAHIFAGTLGIAQQEINAARRAGKMTPEKERVLHYYREMYKDELLGIVRNTFEEVRHELQAMK